MCVCVYTAYIVRLIVHLNTNNILMLLVRNANTRGTVMFQVIGLALFTSGFALYSDHLTTLLRIPDRGENWKTEPIFISRGNTEPVVSPKRQDIETLGILMLVVGSIIMFTALLALIGTVVTSIRWKLYIAVYMLQSFIIKAPRSNTAQHSTAQHSTAQHSTAQHSTAQHSTAQHSTAQHSTAQHSTAQHSTAQHSTAQHSTAQHSTAQHSTAQHSTAQHSTAQHSTAQHSTAQHSTAQHSTAQHSTAQHSTAQHSTAQHSTAQHSTAQHSTAQHSTTQVYYSIILDTSDNVLLHAEHKDNPRHC